MKKLEVRAGQMLGKSKSYVLTSSAGIYQMPAVVLFFEPVYAYSLGIRSI